MKANLIQITFDSQIRFFELTVQASKWEVALFRLDHRKSDVGWQSEHGIVDMTYKAYCVSDIFSSRFSATDFSFISMGMRSVG